MLAQMVTKASWYFYLTLMVLLCVPVFCFASDFQVVDVIEGDTITIHLDGSPVEIRLAAIDCPEMDQPWGEQAKQFTANLVLNKKISIWPIGVDRWGRVIAWVYIEDIDLNKALLRAGLAWHDRRQSRESLLTALELEARAAKKGLWSDPERIPPWEWRKGPNRNAILMNKPEGEIR